MPILGAGVFRRDDMTAPCKDCADRHPLCHGECERYRAFDAQNQERRAKRHMEQIVNDAMSQGMIRTANAFYGRLTYSRGRKKKVRHG